MFAEARIAILNLWGWFVISMGQVGYLCIEFIYLGYGPYKQSKIILESSLKVRGASESYSACPFLSFQ